MDADEGGWTGDGFGAAGDFYRPRIEPGTWCDAVDDDRRFPGACDVTELLGGVHVAASHVERAEFGVERPFRRHNMWGSIAPDGGHPAEVPGGSGKEPKFGIAECGFGRSSAQTSVGPLEPGDAGDVESTGD